MRRGKFLIRPATLDDCKGIARVHVLSWQSTYRGIFKQAYLNSLNIPARTERWREILTENTSLTLLALTADGEVVGFCSGGPVRTKRDTVYGGEIYALYVLSDYQRMGIGHSLLCAMARQLRKEGIRSLCVWVAEKNSARHFYKALEGKEDHGIQQEMAETEVRLIRFGWESLDPLTGTPSRP